MLYLAIEKNNILLKNKNKMTVKAADVLFTNIIFNSQDLLST